MMNRPNLYHVRRLIKTGYSFKALLFLGLLVNLVGGRVIAQDVDTDSGEPFVIPAYKEGVQPVQTPSLAQLEPLVADQLKKAQKTLLSQLDPDDDPQSSTAYAIMGEIYHAYAIYIPAEVCYRNAILLDSFRSSSRYLLARLLHEQSKLDDVESLYKQFLERHSDYGPAWYWLGTLYLETQKLDEATQAYHKVLALHPSTAAAEAGLGRVALEQGAYEKAIDHFEKALLLLPEATRLNYHISRAYRKLGDNEKSRVFLAKSGKIGPRMPDPLYGRIKEHTAGERLFLSEAKTAYAAGDLETAASLYLKALEANPDSLSANINLGSVYGTMGKVDEAISHLEKALALDNDKGNAHFNLALLLLKKKENEKAEHHLLKAIALDEKDLSARDTLARQYLARGAYEEALGQYQAIASVRADVEDVLVQRARLLLHLGRFKEAFEAMSGDLGRHPGMGRLAHLFARLLASCPQMELRNGEEALLWATRVVKAMPSSRHLETYAMALAQNGQCKDAAQAMERSVYAAMAEGLEEEKVNALKAEFAYYRDNAPCLPR